MVGVEKAGLACQKGSGWCEMAMFLSPPKTMSEIAFHEKAGRSQVDSFLFFIRRAFILPSGHCRHASIRTLEERFVFARCMLGVLVTAGAAI